MVPFYLIPLCRIAYAFITRHIATSPLSESQEDMAVIRDLFKELTPFLVEKRSQTLLKSMDDISTDFWGKLVPSGKASRDSFPLLLRDAAFLLYPKRVTEISGSRQQTIVSSSQYSDLSSHPHGTTIRALSDILQFFHYARKTKKSEISTAENSKETPTTHRLRFYAAYIAMLPSPILGRFAAEVAARAFWIEEEHKGAPRAADSPVSHTMGKIPLEKYEGIKTSRLVIEEL